MYDVVIIGGGVVGCLIARELSRYQLTICLLEREKEVASKSTAANSGIIHPGFFDPPVKLKARLNMQGSKMMEGLCSELSVPFRRCGALMLALNEEQAEKLKLYYNQGVQNNVSGIELIDGETARRMEPNISPDTIMALHAPSTAIVDPHGLAVAAAKHAAVNGATIRTGSQVKSIEKTPDGFQVSTENETVCAKVIVNAAGVYSDSINNMVSHNKFYINPVKGEYCRLGPSHGSLVSRTIFQTPSGVFKGILVTPAADGSILLGPTEADTAGKEDFAITLGGIEKIKRDTGKLVPGLPFEHAVVHCAGLRAVSPVHDFIIGEAPDAKGFVNAAAIESPGLTASPAIAKRITEIIGEKCLTLIPKTDFKPYQA